MAAETPIPSPFPMASWTQYNGYTMPRAAMALPPRSDTQRLSTMLFRFWKRRATARGMAIATIPFL